MKLFCRHPRMISTTSFVNGGLRPDFCRDCGCVKEYRYDTRLASEDMADEWRAYVTQLPETDEPRRT